MVKPTVREQQERAKAKDEVRPYYKRVEAYEKACPYCGATIDFHTEKCECGRWQYNWSSREYTYTPCKPTNS